MHDTYLRQILSDDLICDDATPIILKHREVGQKTWHTTEGFRLDDPILRWMDCLVLAGRWERNKPFQIAVEGEPHEWGKG